jgi:Dolichyl-phosphate-mannose-protein mannosyltransferase
MSAGTRPLAASRTAPWVRSALVGHRPYLAIIVAFAVLAGLPVFRFQLMSGPDASAYLPRHVELYEGLKDGQILPRWGQDLAWGYGEPTFNYNAPLESYVSVAFHALGFGFIAGEDLAIFALLLLAATGMYLLAGEFFGRRGGLVAAVAYLFSPSLLARLYVIHTLTDFSAFAFMPFCYWGGYLFVATGRGRYFLIGAVALGLLVFSSEPVALMTFPTLVLLMAWQAWAQRSRRAVLRGVLVAAVGLGLPAFFWLPALTEGGYVQLQRRAERFDLHQQFIPFHQLFYTKPGDVAGALHAGLWTYGDSLHDAMKFAIGPVHLLAAVVALVLVRRVWKSNARAARLVLFFLVVLVLGAFFTLRVSEFLWDNVTLLPPFQFPLRFLSLVAVATSFLCGFPLLFLHDAHARLASVLAAAIIAAVLAFSLPHAHPRTYLQLKESDYSPQLIAAKGISTTAREFEPVWVEEFPPGRPHSNRVDVLSGHGEMLNGSFRPAHWDFTAAMAETGQVRVNQFYFPNWTLRVDGNVHDYDVSEPDGLMVFPLAAGTHRVQLDLRDTPVRTWATRLSLLALAVLVLWPWLPPRLAPLIRRPANVAAGC